MPQAFGFWLVGFGWFGWLGLGCAGFGWLGLDCLGFGWLPWCMKVPLRVTGMDVKLRNEWNQVTTLKL